MCRMKLNVCNAFLRNKHSHISANVAAACCHTCVGWCIMTLLTFLGTPRMSRSSAGTLSSSRLPNLQTGRAGR